jgi:oxygen-independent coproporphyrinogen-3 oxidase
VIEIDRLRSSGDHIFALAEKHVRPGPRYTSYPTADRFTTDVTAAAYEARLDAAAQRVAEPLAVYVHIPFCEQRCDYCGCHVVPTQRHGVAGPYVDRLEKEIELVGRRFESRRPLRVLHIGGGTPTFLSADELERLMSAVLARFPQEDAAELSIEIDPRRTGVEQIERLARLGFRRASLGVQDFDDEVQAAIGRHQSALETEECFRAARAAGFDGINIDLVYGLPRQTLATIARTVERVRALRPDRVAFYGYAHLPLARSNQRRIDESTLPGPRERLALFLEARDGLAEAGYVDVGMDHFALPTDELAIASREGRLGRNFMGYTPHAELEIIGFGTSAIGSVGGAYVQDAKKLADWYKALDAGRLPIERGLICREDDRAARWVIHRILCDFHADAEDFERRFDEPMWRRFSAARSDLVPLAEDGLVQVDDRGVAVTPLGRLFVRNIALPFDERLRADRERAGRVYSRTV